MDKNQTACRITAFSLYLAFLDQLLPSDIRELQRQRNVLPRLVYVPDEAKVEEGGGTIRCADFFTTQAELPVKVHCIVGNPPWASVKDKKSAVVGWCAERNVPFPDRQIATASIGEQRITYRKTEKYASFSLTARYSTIVRLRSLSNESGSGNTPSNWS